MIGFLFDGDDSLREAYRAERAELEAAFKAAESK